MNLFLFKPLRECVCAMVLMIYSAQTPVSTTSIQGQEITCATTFNRQVTLMHNNIIHFELNKYYKYKSLQLHFTYCNTWHLKGSFWFCFKRKSDIAIFDPQAFLYVQLLDEFTLQLLKKFACVCVCVCVCVWKRDREKNSQVVCHLET